MLKKENKIFVAVCPDVRTRRQMISRLAVRLGFALIPSDAAKLIQEDLYSCDLSTAYFVMCAQYNFRNSPVTNQRLYEMAARGLCVIVGVRSLPREYEFITQAFYPEDISFKSPVFRTFLFPLIPLFPQKKHFGQSCDLFENGRPIYSFFYFLTFKKYTLIKNEEIFVQSCNCVFFDYNILIYKYLCLHDFCTIPFDLSKNVFYGFLCVVLHFVRKSCANCAVYNILIFNILQ